LGYLQARRHRGEAVPLLSIADQLAPLARLLAERQLSRLVVGGDLFEEEPGPELVGEFVTWLRDTSFELLGIAPGNHDQELNQWNAHLPIYEEGVYVGEWLVVHGHDQLPNGPVVHGHVHPWLRLGRQINVPCYLLGEQQLVLPALSQDASGVNVLAEPGWVDYRCLACSGRKVLDLGKVGRLQSTQS
jgi:metallophosphoesterase superfamily enzyme